MSQKRATIGRTFQTTSFTSENAENSQEQIFTLGSGRKAIFVLQTIPANSVAEMTFVVQETNGRDQSSLTPDSLSDITRTFRMQQFFPCIGIMTDGKIEIIDGSRRRAAAIFCHSPLNVMVTTSPITTEDARKLASDIQTAREHNIREIGFRLQALKDSGLSQKEIAEQEGLSQAKVTRALQAASVSHELVSIFPVQSELTIADYKKLISIESLLSTQGLTVDGFVSNLAHQMDTVLADKERPSDEIKNHLMRILVKGTSLLEVNTEVDETVVSYLWSFPDRDRYARKKVKGRSFSYEFNRLPKDIQKALDDAIDDILLKHLS